MYIYACACCIKSRHPLLLSVLHSLMYSLYALLLQYKRGVINKCGVVTIPLILIIVNTPAHTVYSIKKCLR